MLQKQTTTTTVACFAIVVLLLQPLQPPHSSACRISRHHYHLPRPLHHLLLRWNPETRFLLFPVTVLWMWTLITWWVTKTCSLNWWILWSVWVSTRVHLFPVQKHRTFLGLMFLLRNSNNNKILSLFLLLAAKINRTSLFFHHRPFRHRQMGSSVATDSWATTTTTRLSVVLTLMAQIWRGWMSCWCRRVKIDGDKN